MAILAFLIHLLSGAILLLFAVRFMRIGIERLWAEKIRDGLSGNTRQSSLLARGALLGFVMQGATVVVLMGASLASSGVVPLGSAVLLAIGADLGSAVAVRFLTLPISALGPLAILLGGWLYLNASQPDKRNLGRVILGLGMIFLALAQIRGAVEPIRDLSSAAASLSYLNQDLVTACITGLALTLLMHSSLAAILTGIAFAAQGVLSVPASLAFVLGCNIGSAVLPVWLLRNEQDAGQIVAKAIAVLRIVLAIVLLGILLASTKFNSAFWANLELHNAILLGHLAFNAILVFIAPVSGPVVRALRPAQNTGARTTEIANVDLNDDPLFAISVVKSKVDGMLNLLRKMFDEVTHDAPDAERIERLEGRMNSELSDLRQAYANLPYEESELEQDVKAILEFAIRLEACGDTLSGKYATIQLDRQKGSCQFSKQGQTEIESLVNEVRKGIHLAQNVFWNSNQDLARRLVVHKQNVTKLEEHSRRAHLERVHRGNLTSLSSSNHHLETIAALKAVNSKLATIAYAVLEEKGGLRKSRLKGAGK